MFTDCGRSMWCLKSLICIVLILLNVLQSADVQVCKFMIRIYIYQYLKGCSYTGFKLKFNSWWKCHFSVTIKGCGDFKFQGFLLQARLAQFAKQDVKIGVFGIYNNAPYQYTCPDLRLVSNTGTEILKLASAI